MKPPQKWNLKRPGIVIPVFFLSLFPVKGQVSWQEASVASLGNTFLVRTGFCHANHNQAGLGRIEMNSVTLQHSRPFILKELGISTLSAQCLTEDGALGATLTSFGIEGLRKTSAWISYGLRLQNGITAGLGLHFWASGIPNQKLFHPGFSFAIGIQAEINDQFVIGAHVLHPVGWYGDNPGERDDHMAISVGGSYTFFQRTIYYSDLQIIPGNPIQSGHGIELKFKEQTGILMGLSNRPFSISGGVAITFQTWILHAAFKYAIDSGVTPSSSFTYGW